MTTGLALLFLLHLLWVINLEGLYPNLKNFLSPLSLVNGKLSHNCTLEIFRPEVIFLLNDETVQVNNLTGKYITELSILKHLQWYITNFELHYSQFECNPQIHQLSTKFHHTIESVFEALETSCVDISTAHSMIDPIFKINFDNIFHRQNRSNQRQRVHKPTCQQYQSRYFQRSRTSSITYLKE